MLAALAFLVVSGCLIAPKHKWPDFRTPEEAHDAVCGFCHKLYKPEFFSSEEWDTFLRRHPESHRPKPEVMDSIYDYLIMSQPAPNQAM